VLLLVIIVSICVKSERDALSAKKSLQSESDLYMRASCFPA